jgi:hypothetical protein
MKAKSLSLNVRVWWDPQTRYIKLAGKGLTASTVSNDPKSRRYHPNLFRKLATALREADLPAPSGSDEK